jgi:hypothetical protein
MIWIVVVLFPAGEKESSLPYSVQTCSVAHPASYPMDTADSVWEQSGSSLKLTTHCHLVSSSGLVELYLCFLILVCLHGWHLI